MNLTDKSPLELENEMMRVKEIIKFLNNVDLQRLNESLNELDRETDKIFSRTNSDVNSLIIDKIKDKNEEFFIWFCFLRANFLRGKDIISNKAFVKFCEKCQKDYYFDKFPAKGNLLPKFDNPKFRQAKAIEEVLWQLRDKYNSGSEFVNEIKNLADSFEVTGIHELYLELIAKFMSFKWIGSKIANAILAEIPLELTLMKKRTEENFQNLLKNEWIKKLVLASCFNVMVDTHVKNFFKEKMGINVENSILIFLSKSVKPELVKSLFERNFGWIEEKDLLLKNYHEYIGANVIEKLLWSAYFVKKNSKGNVNDLQFFKLSNNNNLFL